MLEDTGDDGCVACCRAHTSCHRLLPSLDAVPNATAHAGRGCHPAITTSLRNRLRPHPATTARVSTATSAANVVIIRRFIPFIVSHTLPPPHRDPRPAPRPVANPLQTPDNHIMIHPSLALTGLILAQAGTGQPTATTNPLVVWGIVLIGLALALFLIEVFVPSGGIIGFVSAASLIAGVVMFFRVDTTLGLISALVALASLPLAIAFAIRIWPDTWVARMLTLQTVEPANDPANPDAAAVTRQALVGKRGKAMTELRPVGTCLIEGHREECLASRGVIEPGTEIEVVSVDGMQIKVKATS